MPNTQEVIDLTDKLRSIAQAILNTAREAEQHNELTPLAVEKIKREVFQPLLDETTRLLQAQDHHLLQQTAQQLHEFDQALKNFETELETTTAAALLNAGINLVTAAGKIVAFIANPNQQTAIEATGALTRAVKDLLDA